jgi:TonB-dependent SusC/RagA subfamily outer membrane receptor
MRHLAHAMLGTIGLLLGAGRATPAQLLRESDSERAPRFLYAQPRAKTPILIDAATVPMLRRRISLDLQNVGRREALVAIARESNLDLAYPDAILPAGGRVSLVAAEITVAAALTDVLLDAGVDVVVSPNGGAVLVKRIAPKAPAVGTVTGRVTDAASGQPVAAAQVIVVGTTFGRTTDANGEYSIGGLPAGDFRVTTRRVGYVPVTKSVTVRDGASVTVDFALVPAPTQLTEVVTTVTGQQQRYQIGNAITHINTDSLVREAPITRLADVLMARVAGAQIVPNSGFSGESPRVRIRGISSVTISRDPLLYIDGVRVDNSTGEIAHHVVGFLTYGHIPGRFNDVVPEDIESIEIVKGPSAATLYGTDAANGVIVVKTKRGEAGRATWRVFSEAGVLAPATTFQPSYYSWGHNSTTGAAQRCLLVQQAARTCVVDSLTTFSPLTDDDASMIGTGARWQLGAQLSGGVERFRYFFSAEQERERSYLEMPAGDVARISAERGGAAVPEEQIHPNALRKLSLRANVNTSFNRADIAVSSGLLQNYTRIPRGNEWAAAYWGPGYRDANNGYEASRGRPGESFSLLSAEDATRFINSVNATWRPADWLSLRSTVGFDYSSMEYNGLQRRGEGAGTGRGTGSRLSMRTGLSLTTVDLGASAFTNLGAHFSSRTSVGAQYNRRSEAVTFANATGLPPGSETVTGAATLTGGERTIGSVVAGAYVEQMFGLRERVFVTGAVRADGGSTFGKNFNTAEYPKASLSWLLS